MAINFPGSPQTNDLHTIGSFTYKYDGDKWIGVGLTPIDRLVEGANSLEINASNQLVWSGDDIIQSSANKSFKSNSTSSGDYVRMYAGGGTAQWDIYGNGELLRMSDNSSSATAKVQFDNPTFHRSTATTTGVAALTAKQEVNNGGYLIFDGKNSSDTTVFSVTHNGRVAVSDGIDFSANANAAGMTSELLDDYEEGTFTPTVTGRTVNGTATYSRTAVGKYTKIGNVVHVMIDMVFNSATGNGNIQFGPLPFAASGGPYVRFAGSVVALNNSFGAFNDMKVYLNDGNSYVWLVDVQQSGGYNFFNVNSAQSEVLINLTYFIN